MSALAALFQRDGQPASRDALAAMLDAVLYRGPDGVGTRLLGTVALGCAKLALTPEEEREQQPLLSPRTGCAIVAEVRLDNRAELLAALPDHPSPSASDAEIILRAYEAWDLGAAVRLLGDFAFLIWDPRRQRLIGARDTSGQRALFYRVDPFTFAAASEIHQLFQDPAVPVSPCDERIRHLLVPYNLFGNEKDQAATYYQGIHSVPAGHLLIVDRERVRVQQYWELVPQPELRYRTEEEYTEHFRSLLFEAIRARLRSSRPLGALMSAGLDSSSIVCAAQELYRAGRAVDRGFTSFSTVFAGLECDEGDRIREIQAKYGFDARYLPDAPSEGWLQVAPAGFQPSPLTRVGTNCAAYDMAGQAGIRVLLTGDVADSCIGGSRMVFDSLFRHGCMAELWRQLRIYQRLSQQSLLRVAAFHCFCPLLPLSLQRPIACCYIERWIRRNREHLSPWWMPRPLREELVDAHLRLSLEAERRRRFASPARESEFRMLRPPEAAGHLIGWPLSIWRPFADRRLHEFLLAVPPEQKFVPQPETDNFYAGSKQLLRRAMRGILPESIRTQTSKVHFAAAFQSEIERQWPLFEEVFGPSAEPEVALRGYVDRGLFWGRLQQLREGDQGNDFIYVMRLIALESWLRRFKQPRPELVTVRGASRVGQTAGKKRASSLARSSVT